MATIKTLPVIADLGSQEVAQLIHSYNHLLDTLGTLITGLKTAVDVPAINTLATTAETSMQDFVYMIKEQPNIPLAPGFKAV